MSICGGLKAACTSCGGCRGDFPSVQDFVEGTAHHGVRIHSLESGGAHDMGSPYPRDLMLLGYSSLCGRTSRSRCGRWSASLMIANWQAAPTARQTIAQSSTLAIAWRSRGMLRFLSPRRSAASRQAAKPSKRRAQVMRARVPRAASRAGATISTPLHACTIELSRCRSCFRVEDIHVGPFASSFGSAFVHERNAGGTSDVVSAIDSSRPCSLLSSTLSPSTIARARLARVDQDGSEFHSKRNLEIVR